MIANLFIIGEQKSGTTTLHSLLDQHPEISMSTMKEPGFFCTDLHRESDKYYGKQVWFPVRTSEQFHKYFNNHTDKTYRGESSTLYLYSKEAASNIYSYADNPKFIAIFRDPVDYLYSLHAQYVKEAVESIENFKTALESETSRKKSLTINKTLRAPSLLFYSERIRYADNLERFLTLFGTERVLVLFAEDLNIDTDAKTKEIFEWLNLDGEIKLNTENKNVSEVARFKSVQKLMNAPWFTKIKCIILNILPEKTVGRATEIFHTLTRKKAPRERLEREYRMELMIKFKPEVVKLKSLFKKYNIPLDPISKWGYNKL
ncbi:sulfotransferase family protein [Vibrio natriegens]|uniref:sulfotransferase family protein n=1 Tax=Vibrio natriegens TaxID=691 RepID=UPI003F8604DB